MTFDSTAFRQALSQLPTGVAVVALAEEDEIHAMTVGSFTSLSLDPPLVLFCVANSSSTWPRIEAAGTFAINILGEGHEDLSNLFAKKGADRFSATPWHTGVSGAPVLDEAIAYLDCRFEAEYPGGDHKIVVGRVLDLDLREGARPLLFFRGKYTRMGDL